MQTNSAYKQKKNDGDFFNMKHYCTGLSRLVAPLLHADNFHIQTEKKNVTFFYVKNVRL